VIKKLEDILDQLCSEVAYILSSSSIIEASVFKPGNASRIQDIKSVKYEDVLLSANLANAYYRKACIRGYNSSRPLYDLLYLTIKESKKMEVNYSILGTQLLLLPISYSSLLADNVDNLRRKLSELIISLDVKDTKWFFEALKQVELSYLGKIDVMDYRETANKTMYEVLVFSSNMDTIARNMIRNYEYSYIAYKIIKDSESLEKGIQKAFIEILSEQPDGLIYRKYGGKIALLISHLAREVKGDFTEKKLLDFNNFLVKNNYNPGSTADIIASGIALYLLDKWYEKTRNDYPLPLPRGCSRIYK
jgi:triphosphoribosyl-dephospho-CoA synthase